MERKKPPTKSLRSTSHQAVITVIAATRREAGLTQDDLASKLRWHRSTIAKIEAGERRVDVSEFIKIAEALKIAPDLLFQRVLRW
jgi:transcriptional regulator with XRE-family HTH domain